MAIAIKSLECNLASNVTKVTFDITEKLGPITRVKETLTLDIEGKHTTIDDVLLEQISEILEQQGLSA
jgi:hypothetical protein